MAAPLDDHTLAQLERLVGCGPDQLLRGHGGLRVANDDRLVLAQGKLQGPLHLHAVGRGQQDHVGHHPHIADIHQPVVGRTVGPDHAGPVHAKDHRKILQRHFLEDLIETALQKRRIDADHRFHTALGHAGRDVHRRTLGNAHVVESFRMFLAEAVQARAVAHRRGNGHNAVILLGQGGQGLSKGLSESRTLGDGGRFDAVAVDFERAGRMKPGRSFVGRIESLALLRVDVEKHRVIHLAQGFEQSHERFDIVAVHGAEVRDVEALEQLAGRDHHTDALLDLLDGLLDAPADAGKVFEDVPRGPPQVFIGLTEPRAGEILGHRTHGRINGHAVVVEHDE